ncbi:MAG: discoidin domain-containing protein, partial [Clostridia bacterium]|nr:discoidin domain-containing protein [Clostridia bacterium]
EYVTAFLQKGINIIDIDTAAPIALDYIRVKKAEGNPIAVEAEMGALSGNAQTFENAFASEKVYVANIEGGTEDALTLSLNAPEAGKYKMVIHHSSSELFGGHTYNAQLVDRYASFKLNDNESKRLYFKNSYSDSNWRTTVLTVELKEGENTVTVFNDNWRIVKNGTGETGNITYNTLVNYTPNFDLFEFYPSVTENSSLTENLKMSVMQTEHGTVDIDAVSVAPGESVTLTFYPEYKEGKVEVLANGEDVSGLIEDNTLTYTPNTDTEFLVNFIIPENLDNYIVNSSFGTGDFTGWENSTFEIVEENGIHYAYADSGMLWQTITCPEGYYDISFKAKGEDGAMAALQTDDAYSAWELTDSWATYTIRTYSDGEIVLKATALGAYVDDFTLNIGKVDENLLYFVDCGDIDPTTINEGDKYGIYNSVTEQFCTEDAVTGMEWGVVDTYVPNTTYPHLTTGAETWPYEYDLSDGEDKVITYRYAKDQDDRTGNGITYKFALPEDGEYAFEVAFYAPSHWQTSVNRKASLTMNGEVLQSGIIPSTDAANPNIVKKVASVTGGEAILNLKLDSDGAGGPMMSYIKISKAPDVSHIEKIDTTNLTITGSATWNNDPATQAKFAFDGNLETFFDGVSGGYLMVDLGEPTSIGAIGYYPRSNWAGRMVSTSFYGSVDGANWEQLFVITQAPPYGVETLVTYPEFLNTGEYRYIKYQNPSDYCNVAEINIYALSDSIPFTNYDTEVCRMTFISIEDGNYYFEYEEGSTGTIIQVVRDGDVVTQVKRTPLTTDPVPQISENEEIYIWDVEKLKPLVSINK